MKRLEAVFSLITPCGLFADIGTDHGLIASRAAEVADTVVATDISEKCLAKARANVTAANVRFAAGNGLTVLGDDPDIIAVCGMGGYTVTDILTDYTGGAVLILQPQNDVPHVREFLAQNEYIITDDLVAYERGKFYDVLRAERGRKYEREHLTNLMLLFGKFYQNKNPLLKNRLLKLRQSYQSYKPTDKNLEFLKFINEALNFQ